MESPAPLSRYIPPNPKKRVFPGGSSSCMEMEADVVEIPPPLTKRGSKSKSIEKKEVIFPEIIDVDLDEEIGGVILIDDDEEVVPSGKGKEIVDNRLSGPSDKWKGSVDDALLSKNLTPAYDNKFFSEDLGLGADLIYGDDNWLNKYYDDIVHDNEYAILQSHFGILDMPTGIEAPFPWLMEPVANKTKSSTITTSLHSTSESKLLGVDPLLSSSPLESVHLKKSNPSSSYSPGTPLSGHGKTHSSTWSLPQSAQGKSSSTTPGGYWHSNSQLNVPGNRLSQEKPPKSHYLHASSPLKNKPLALGAALYDSFQKNFQGINIQGNHGNVLGSSLLFDGSYGPSNGVHGFPAALNTLVLNSPTAAGTSEIASQSSSVTVKYDSPDEIMKRFQLFKKFDTVQDVSDHYYHQESSSLGQPSKNWAKKIQDEWKILEKDLPDAIFVRVYESRMDLLRAVIVGAEGTPYHDGLFFFDVQFPCNYPNVPPKVHYHSGGLRINPNLYNCGKVCLSLLNTWGGSHKEMWTPGVSTMLQVLVSIQGLILNAKPFFNEPGFARMSGSASGEISSLQYNERTFILSLKTMVYTIRRPPKYFEDLVAGHFYNLARDILVACRSYIDGAQVGYLVKGGVKDVDKGGKSCSQVFRYDVASFINTLVDALKLVGAKECEEFLPLAEKANGPRPFTTNMYL